MNVDINLHKSTSAYICPRINHLTQIKIIYKHLKETVLTLIIITLLWLEFKGYSFCLNIRTQMQII